MKLSEMEDAAFIRYYREDEHDCFAQCQFSEAHGIRFECPKGHHLIQVFFAGSPVPPHIGTNKEGKMVRWNKSGTGLADLTLTPSIQEQDDICGWHGFITNGEAN
jgi:hypothetical protein